MCRMLGAVLPAPVEPRALRAPFDGFRALVREGRRAPHQDGVGLVTAPGGRVAHWLRTPRAADDPAAGYDDAVARLVAARPRGPLLAHLRDASAGGVSLANTHPFVRDGWAFCHNGTVHGDLPAPPGAVCEGSTDSEKLFLALLARIRGGEAPGRAIRDGVRSFVDGRTYSSSTLLMTDGRRLYAYRDATKRPEYYTLYVARGPGGSAWITQEPLPGMVVEREVENRGLVVVEPDGLARDA